MDPKRRKAQALHAQAKAGNADSLISWYNDGADGQIDWGSPGDWQQCVDVASQYMSEDDAAGFCELRHQDATGMSTSEHAAEEGGKGRAEPREVKYFQLRDFKAVDRGNGYLEGYLAVFNNVDDGGDRILPGAFRDTLEEFKRTGFFAVNHNWDALPIGYVDDAYEDNIGLWVRFAYHSHQAAQDARSVAKERLAAGKSVGESIGYEILPGGVLPGKDGSRRDLTKLGVFEGSQVSVPMNRRALATAVKGQTAPPKDTPKAGHKWMGDYYAPTSAPQFFGGEPLEGTYEDLIEDLQDALNVARMGMPWSGSYGCVLVLATYPDRCIAVTWGSEDDPDEPVYWSVPYTLDQDGDPVLGQPQEVAIQFAPVGDGGVSFMGHAGRLLVAAREFTKRADARRERRVKEGRELSSGNRETLGAILDALDGVLTQLRELHSRTEPKPKDAEKAARRALLEFERIRAQLNGVAV